VQVILHKHSGDTGCGLLKLIQLLGQDTQESGAAIIGFFLDIAEKATLRLVDSPSDWWLLGNISGRRCWNFMQNFAQKVLTPRPVDSIVRA
jgi:hypothetical protein